MYEDGILCLWMRGGTSKGAYFLAEHLPADQLERDALLLRIMGSPDPRQIDGIGGADPLTSKVAVLSPSSRDDADVDYLFLQVFVDQELVSDPGLRKHPGRGWSGSDRARIGRCRERADRSPDPHGQFRRSCRRQDLDAWRARELCG
ncbi:hypothetical protein RvVAT039_pl06760 (plasmid) [Agrobacterium vitis]|nr:hypothetical protein RvVAT039_pl06760 [Agrobacterium vitis]